MPNKSDYSVRFLFEQRDIRGALTNLQTSYAEVLAKHPYPQEVAELLGELLAAAALLCDNLKFDGLLTLQVRSRGPVSLLMAECSSRREIRAIARYDGQQCTGKLLPQLMPEGTLAVTVDPEQGQRYQGLAALDQPTLADCLSAWFSSSQQLSTRFHLNADGRRARGMLLQELPPNRIDNPEERTASWEHVTLLSDTLTPEELLGLDDAILLRRLYHEYDLQLFSPEILQFRCTCSRERSAGALRSLDKQDAMQLIRERQGEIVIDCQFCNQRYYFDASDVHQLFAGGGSTAPSQTRH